MNLLRLIGQLIKLQNSFRVRVSMIANHLARPEHIIGDEQTLPCAAWALLFEKPEGIRACRYH